MHIHYLSSSALISDSANSVHVTKMCQAFAGQNYDVTLHGYFGNGDTEDVYQYYAVQDNFNIKRHDEYKSGLSSWFWWLRKKIPFLRVAGLPSSIYAYTKLRPNIGNPNNLVYARNLFWLFAIRKEVPFIMEVHHPAKNIIERWIEKRLYKRLSCKGIVLISEKMRNIYVEKYPQHANKFIVAHDGADDPKPQNIETRLARPLKHIGYVGQIYEGRGINVILKTAQICPELTFHIVGGNQKAIEQYKNNYDISENVIFHGHQPHAKLHEFYNKFDAVLSPYQKKVAVHGNAGDTSAFMSPLKIFEYMSWGFPILCSDMPVLKEVLKHEHNALLLKPDDANAWAEALITLKENDKLKKKISMNARQDFCEKHSWHSRAKHILNEASV